MTLREWTGGCKHTYLIAVKRSETRSINRTSFSIAELSMYTTSSSGLRAVFSVARTTGNHQEIELTDTAMKYLEQTRITLFHNYHFEKMNISRVVSRVDLATLFGLSVVAKLLPSLILVDFWPIRFLNISWLYLLSRFFDGLQMFLPHLKLGNEQNNFVAIISDAKASLSSLGPTLLAHQSDRKFI